MPLRSIVSRLAVKGTPEPLTRVLTDVALVAYTTLVVYPLIATIGLPSYEKGVFHTATIGYYMSTVRLIQEDGLITGAWCGFSDLLRFYPPLSLVGMYAVSLTVGNLLQGAMISFYFAIVFLVLSFHRFALAVTGSRTVAFLAALLLPVLPRYVEVTAIYWEYTRIAGEAVSYYALYRLVLALRMGSARDFALAGALYGLVLLTSLIAFIEATLLAIATVAYSLRARYKEGSPPGVFAYLGSALSLYALSFAAVAAWWLVPAVAPFGVSGYLRVETPLEDRLLALAGLFLEPGDALYAVGGSLSLIAITIRPGAGRLLVIYALLLVSLVVLTSRGARFLPTLEAMLALSMLYAVLALHPGARYGRYRLLARPLLAVGIAVAYALTAWNGIAVYRDMLALDYTFQSSDEYKLSVMLAGLDGDYRAYIMYGPRLHGNQWVNLFNPSIKQVLSGFMEGCMLGDYQKLDSLVKNTLDTARVKLLLDRTCTAVMVVDREFYESKRNVVRLLVEEGYLVEDKAMNQYLDYSLVFWRAELPDCVVGGPPGYLTPAKLLGLAISAVAAIMALSKLRRLD